MIREKAIPAHEQVDEKHEGRSRRKMTCQIGKLEHFGSLSKGRLLLLL